MKIAIDSSCLVLNRFSGLSEVVHNLIRNLPFVTDNNQITLYLNYFRNNGALAEFNYPGTGKHYFRLPRRFVNLWWDLGMPAFDRYLKDIDVFHSLHINVPPTKRMKTILTVHDCRYMAHPEFYNVKEVEIYKQQMETSLKRVDCVCAVSEFTRQELLSYFNFPSERIKVIHNGFEPIQGNKEYFIKKANHYLEVNNLPKSYLLFIGTLDPRKNINRLIDAVARCKMNKKDFPDIILGGIAPGQWTRSKYAYQAKELGLYNHIHPCGVLEKDVLIGLTRQACALCYPSLYEGFGFPPLEAMSLGVPVLAGKKSSIPEIVGNSACLVNPERVDEIVEGLNKILFDSDYRKFLIESGYRQTIKFSWRKAAEEYMDIYKKASAS